MKISNHLKQEISPRRLRRVVYYNPIDGLFRWKERKAGRSLKKPLGNISHGYLRISIDGVSYQSHRLAWLYCYGEWPISDIDHINGSRLDNRIENLRLATRSQNLANSRTRRNGLKGCYFHKKKQKWHARLQTNYKPISLGYYRTEQEAHNAYCKAAKKYHGEFARAQ